ncbi:flagellar protein FliO [Pseudomonas sp. M47T1]|uniref:flagellar biosynthetic protein FliO n=1 Tax=unclassified Pseudomonas TaxID=196821 RepID=UPI00026083CD|nr:flagellar biosynthetic protein FliO [Pseudomonas sp. M47T1]EIK93512.1 flagellar protein FliO [Pseudomonas sp. M47T1]
MGRLLTLLLALPLPAFAATVTAPGTLATPAATAPVVGSALSGGGMAGQLTQLMLGLLLVIGLIFALAWVLRRVQQATPHGGQVIELLGSRALGPRDRLVLVQVGNEQILLGLSPGRIAPLHVMQQPIQMPAKTKPASPDFAQRLMELLGKDQKDKH